MVFYENILKTVKSWDEADRKSLLRWWNRCATPDPPTISSFPDDISIASSSHTFTSAAAQDHSVTLLHPALPPH